MHYTNAAIVAIAALASASPIALQKRQGPTPQATVYGVDPAKAFYLTARSTDNSKSWNLDASFIDFVGGVLGIQAYSTTNSTLQEPSPRSNYTLYGGHYGSQLHAFRAAPCTSAAFCDETLVYWSNDEPKENDLLSFHIGQDEPPFGGLAFYGLYNGGDIEAGSTNYLSAASELDLKASWTLCDFGNGGGQFLAYKGTNASCVPVLVTAQQVPNATTY